MFLRKDMRKEKHLELKEQNESGIKITCVLKSTLTINNNYKGTVQLKILSIFKLIAIILLNV